ncbi:uncharacterized protein EV420DRAFT_1722461 [Desarmillaria tabescens]|uniref:Uncharacterized protein n=1 Tax=Armillaria tabescens TaxID=1929756 RepID=A0AA39JKS2_ARMTA|nr:uncharacterized protein EV420DRAFT_1722461 [Desarmillaria tabescens]KAK0444561.1 hypothetical protein EV420DRAFT_1722461 [Desarmillaria tabescens]
MSGESGPAYRHQLKTDLLPASTIYPPLCKSGIPYRFDRWRSKVQGGKLPSVSPLMAQRWTTYGSAGAFGMIQFTFTKSWLRFELPTAGMSFKAHLFNTGYLQWFKGTTATQQLVFHVSIYTTRDAILPGSHWQWLKNLELGYDVPLLGCGCEREITFATSRENSLHARYRSGGGVVHVLHLIPTIKTMIGRKKRIGFERDIHNVTSKSLRGKFGNVPILSVDMEYCRSTSEIPTIGEAKEESDISILNIDLKHFPSISISSGENQVP